MKIYEGVGVKSVLTEDDKVSSVETTHGDIKCEYFVNCTGMVSLALVGNSSVETTHDDIKC